MARFDRRAFLAGFAAGVGSIRTARAQETSVNWQFTYPIAWPGGVIADGFVNLHGYAVENVPFYPGLWHTGENWHADRGETAGALVLAVADGEVVYAGSDYPGLVVIVRHADDLFSMYGHLGYEAAVAVGDRARRGDLVGTVLQRTDGRLSHLHVELRTFLMTPEVNGNAPRHPFTCGFECPAGPGYWPMSDAEHASIMGWRNPTSVIAAQAFGGDTVPDGAEIIVSQAAGERASVWSAPKHLDEARHIDEMPTTPGDRHRLLEIDAGDPASTAPAPRAIASGTGLRFLAAVRAGCRLPSPRNGQPAAMAVPPRFATDSCQA